MWKSFLLVLILAFSSCGIEIDAEGLLDRKFFDLDPVAETCAQIDIHCETAYLLFDKREDYDLICNVALGTMVSREDLECLAFAESCEAMQECPVTKKLEVVYDFTHPGIALRNGWGN